MKKVLVLFLLLLMGSAQCYAYVEKLYNGCGDLIGEARVYNNTVEWYDTDFHRVSSVQALIDTYAEKMRTKRLSVVGTKEIPLCDQSVCKQYVYYHRNGEYHMVPYKPYIGQLQ